MSLFFREDVHSLHMHFFPPARVCFRCWYVAVVLCLAFQQYSDCWCIVMLRVHIHCVSVCMFWFVASRSASNDVDDDAEHEVESGKKITKKPSAEKAAPIKLVPAPPPKENIWEKRKSENQASRQQQQQPPSASVESTSESTVDKPSQSKTSTESVTASSHGEETSGSERVSCRCPGLLSMWQSEKQVKSRIMKSLHSWSDCGCVLGCHDRN